MTTATMERVNQVSQGPDLSKSVVLIRLERHSFGNSRKLKKDQYEVGVEKQSDGTFTADGDKSMTSASKRLLDSPELDVVRARMGQLRNYVEDQSLPFPVNGVYMLPITKVEDVVFTMDEMIAKVNEAVDDFMRTYRTREKEARERNPKLYNPLDYPPEQVMRSKFSCYYQIVSIGSPESQLSNRVDPEILKKARQSTERLWVDAAEMTRQMQAQIMLELVEHLRDKLTDDGNGKPKRFTTSTLENLQDFMRDFERSANVTDYKELATLVEQGRKLLNGTSTDDLKDSAKLRATIKENFAVIEKSLTSMVGERKVRSKNADEF